MFADKPADLLSLSRLPPLQTHTMNQLMKEEFNLKHKRLPKASQPNLFISVSKVTGHSNKMPSMIYETGGPSAGELVKLSQRIGLCFC